MQEIYKRLLTGCTLGLFVIVSLLFFPPWVFSAFVATLLTLILLTEWPYLVTKKDYYIWLLTPFYPILPFVLVIIMQMTGYKSINILLLSLVAAHDTGSYAIGKLWGKHKINPLVSPGKTWEGFAGGIVLTFAVSFFFFGHNGLGTMLTAILPFTISLCVSALLGDLFESYLKRRAGVKDSGTLLPGHGGILDRVDGLMFAVPFVYVLRHYLTLLLS